MNWAKSTGLGEAQILFRALCVTRCPCPSGSASRAVLPSQGGGHGPEVSQAPRIPQSARAVLTRQRRAYTRLALPLGSSHFPGPCPVSRGSPLWPGLGRPARRRARARDWPLGPFQATGSGRSHLAAPLHQLRPPGSAPLVNSPVSRATAQVGGHVLPA